MEEKKNIREDLTLNFDSDINAMETYAEFEVMNHVIDGYNIAADARAEKLARVRQLLKAPYFARVCLRYAPDEEEETFYIGSAGLTDEHHDHIVIDWRSPVAETYYSQANGRTSYTVDGRKIEVDLTLRRQFALQRDRLQAYFDTSIAIEDPLLIDSLSRRRTDRMQAITATIQKEQNTVIRHRDVPVLLVNGIAGSGKTSVMLQRIAYLFYQKRDSLKPDQVCLLTLNPVFRKYIENVLPDMGESNPRTLTWPEFMEQTGCPERGRQAFTSADSLRQIDGSLAGFVLQPSDVTGISHGGHTFLSAADVWKAVSKYTRFPAGPRLFSLAEDALEETLRRRLSKRGKEPDRKERNRIENQFAGPFQKLRSFAWIRTDQIGRRLLGRDRLTAAQSLYLKMALTGMEDKYTRYVMVDEVQDYTEAQLMVLSRYYRTARFMMLGDENQAIVPDRVAFSAMNDIFGRDHGRVLTCEFIRAEVEAEFKRKSYSAVGTIISCGPDSALPHCIGSGPIKAGAPVVSDIFPRSDVNGYWGDMTRTFVKGKASKRLFEMYKAVRYVNEAVEAQLKPGVPCSLERYTAHGIVVAVFGAAGKTQDFHLVYLQSCYFVEFCRRKDLHLQTVYSSITKMKNANISRFS